MRVSLSAMLLISACAPAPLISPSPDAGGAVSPPDGEMIDDPALDAFFGSHLQTAHLPGAAVAAVRGERIVWQHAYGQANLEDHRAVTTDTLFMLASVSKPVMAVALMHLQEQGRFALDDDVNAQLPFSVRNPHFPNVAITYRMLLTHTSSLEDGDGSSDDVSLGDAHESLRDWLGGYVTPGGAHFARNNWSPIAPGTHASYSNAGAALAGFLVERISGQDLQTYCQQHLFAPLTMTESSWFLRGLEPSHVAMPYEWAHQKFVPQGLYGFPDYPDGQLRTSVSQLARFLSMFMQGGSLEGVQVLKPETVAEMQRVQLPAVDADQALIWAYGHDASTRVLGHGGAFLGVSTDLWFAPAERVGYVFLSNGGTAYDFDTGVEVDAIEEMELKLLELARTRR